MKMKKMIAISLAALTLFSFVACGSDEVGNSSSSVNTGESSYSEETVPESSQEEAVVVTPDVEETTLGGKLWDAFLTEITENPEITAEDMASKLVTNENIQFSGQASVIESAAEGTESYYPGFDNYQISGFDSGAMYLPMMGSIAFVGYVFELPVETDVNEFMKSLEVNCNPGWNICVVADQTVIGSVDNMVFFLMCPESLAK